MEKWVRILIGGGAALAGATAAAYFGIGYVVYRQMATVRGDCDEHVGNSPDHFMDIGGEDWPPFNFSPYYMASYEAVRFPSRQAGLNISGWYVEGDPDAPAVIFVHGKCGCKRAQDVLLPAGMLARNGFYVLMIDVRDVAAA